MSDFYVWRCNNVHPCETCQAYEDQVAPMSYWESRHPAHPFCACTLEPFSEDTQPMQQFRFSAQPLPLTRSANRRYACTLIAAGELAGHGLHVTPDVLRRDVSKFAAAQAFVNHSWFARIESLAGLYEDVRYDETAQAITATLVLKSTPAADWLARLIDETIADQADGAPALNIGLSADVWIQVGEQDENTRLAPIVRFHQVSSVDLVFGPASDGARFDRILAQAGPLHPANSPQEHTPMTDPTTTPAPDPITTPAPTPSVQPDLAAQLAEVKQQLELLAARQAITGFDTPRPQPLVSGMQTPADMAQAITDWQFGVRNAPLPEPEMRSPRAFYHALTGDFDWSGRTHTDRAQFASATTTTLADLAANAMNKVIVETWPALEAYRWFEELVTVQPNDGSVQPMAWVSFGGIANLPTVAQGGAYTELTVGDSKESDAFVKKGGYVGITEEMYRNSDLARMQAIPRALAVAAVRTRSAAIASIFTVNAGVGPTMDDDSVALFNSAHGSNLQTTAFSYAAWQAAGLECYKHTELTSGMRLGLYPKFALLPPDLWIPALTAFEYGSGPGGQPGTGNNDTNPYGVARAASDPRPIPISVPEWTDTNNWAYLVDPALQPVLMMSYTQNPGGRAHPMPELLSVSSPTAGLVFTNDTLPIKVRDWFSYGVATWRGVGKRNVA